MAGQSFSGRPNSSVIDVTGRSPNTGEKMSADGAFKHNGSAVSEGLDQAADEVCNVDLGQPAHPVVTSSGNLYEAATIRQWAATRAIDPLSNKPMRPVAYASHLVRLRQIAAGALEVPFHEAKPAERAAAVAFSVRANAAVYPLREVSLQNGTFLGDVFLGGPGGLTVDECPEVRAIEGDLVIDGASPASLALLREVRQVAGDVKITNLDSADLEFLSSLRTVSGNFVVASAGVRSLRGLERLERAECMVLEGAGIETLEGLRSFRKGMPALSIARCPNLTSLDGIRLRGVRNVGSIHLVDLPKLENIDALRWVRRADNVRIEGTGLRDLRGLDCLLWVAGQLTLAHNPNLRSLSGLRGLQSVDQAVRVEDNASLHTLKGACRFARSLGSVTIRDNPQLENVSALHDMHEVTTLVIENNPALLSLRGLRAMELLLGTATVRNNGALPELRSLREIQRFTHPSKLQYGLFKTLGM